MSNRILLVSLLAWSAASSRGEEPKRDALGDPLPPAAVARLGSVRFVTVGGTNDHLHISGDGKYLSTKNQILFETATGRPIAFPTDRALYAGSMTSPIGRCSDSLAFVCPGDDRIEFVDVPTGKVLRSLPWEKNRSLKLSPLPNGDGFLYLTNEWRKYRLILQRFESPDPIVLSGPPSLTVLRPAYSHDGTRVAQVFDGSGPVRVWETKTGRELAVIPGSKEKGWTDVALTPDGRTLFRQDLTDKVIRVFDVGTGKEVDPPIGAETNARGRSSHPPAVSPDGRYVAGIVQTDGRTETIRVWDWATRKPVRDLPDVGTWFAFVPGDRPRLAVVVANQTRVWDVATGKQVPEPDAIGFRSYPSSVTWSPDGRTVATGPGPRDDDVRVWDASTGKRRLALGGHDMGADGWFVAAEFSPDGKRLATATMHGLIRLWDATTGREEAKRVVSRRLVGDLRFTPDGKTLYVATDEGLVVCDAGTLSESNTVPFKLHHLDRMEVSADARTVFGIGTDPQARRGGNLSGVTFAADLVTRAVKYRHNLSDANRAYAVRQDGTIALVRHSGDRGSWSIAVTNLAGTSTRLRIPGYTQAADFSPDGRLLAVAHLESLVRVIELASGKDRFLFAGHGWGVGRLAFSPDGTRLASTSGDKTILIWDVATPVGPPVAATAVAAWAALAEPDAAAAYTAIRYFTANTGEALKAIRADVKPSSRFDARALTSLVKKLDSPVFAEREAASAELADVVDRIRPALESTVRTTPSAEVRRRLDKILAETGDPLTGDALRVARTIEVLERIGSPAAVEMLKALAEGAPGARLTGDAAGALVRLARSHAAK